MSNLQIICQSLVFLAVLAETWEILIIYWDFLIIFFQQECDQIVEEALRKFLQSPPLEILRSQVDEALSNLS